MIGIIYKITNTINDKIYIGSTSNLNLNFRFSCHLKNAFDNSKSGIKRFKNNKLYKFIKEVNNIHCFNIIEIEKVKYEDIRQLKTIEDYYIILFDSKKNGYNSKYNYENSHNYF